MNTEVVDLYNVREYLKTEGSLPIEYIQGSGNRWRLLREIPIRLTNGNIITVAKGFEWDLSSVPRALWGFKSPYGDFLFAALIHDFLYVTQAAVSSRLEADTEMLIWSCTINRNNTDNYHRYIAVRMSSKGRKWWRLSADKIARGERDPLTGLLVV